MDAMPTRTVGVDGGIRSKNLLGLQHVRAWAALLVVLYHAAATFAETAYLKGVSGWEQLFDFGHAGVEIFFVLSGFIICHVHFGDNTGGAPARRYIRKRLTRIYPPVLLVVMFTVLVKLVTGMPQSIDQIIVSLTLIPYRFAYSPPALWTLSHEMLFYLVFLTAFLSKRLFLWSMGAWSAAVLAIFVLDPAGLPRSPIFGLLISPYNLLFGIGAIAFCIHRNWWRQRPVPLIIAGLIAFLAVAVIDLSWNWGAVQAAERPMRVMTLAYGGSALLLVLGAANLQLTSTGIANRAFLFLGEASYSIYLWHEPAQRSLVRVLMHLGLMDPAFRLFAMTAMILIGVVAGLVAWRFIERPLLRSVATWRSRA